MKRFIISSMLILSLIWMVAPTDVTAQGTDTGLLAQSGTTYIYLPLLASASAPQNPGGGTYSYRVNVPHLSGDINTDSNFSQTAVVWFGSVGSNSDYSDVRIGYNSSELWINLNVLDRTLWYDPSHKADDLTNWDGVTLYLDLAGTQQTSITGKSFRFDSQLNDYEARPSWQAAFTGSGATWAQSSIPFSTIDGLAWGSYTSGGLNNNSDNRGWTTTYHIPFSSLGLSGPPAEGSLWGIALALHDRNSKAGPTLPDTLWPPVMNNTRPDSWAQLRFGIPAQLAPLGTPVKTETIRRDPTRGINVPDAGVGGTTPNLCPGDLNYIWNSWGNDNYGTIQDFNIQNQSKIADWPCFAKYYISFPLNLVPANKIILSATLVLHQFGGSGDPGQALPSLIQISTVSPAWDEKTISWNNAPIPLENVSSAWVDVPSNLNALPWPKQARQWNVTTAAINAYAKGAPLSIALYEADSAYHSGKYFTSSETPADWNLAGRPTLLITWGNP